MNPEADRREDKSARPDANKRRVKRNAHKSTSEEVNREHHQPGKTSS